MGRAAWIVGDVHGCLRELQALEALIARWSERTGREALLVLVGDIIDRGPDSRGVVEHVRRGVEAGTHVVVLGNHEEMFLRVLISNRPDLVADAGVTLPTWVESVDAMLDRRPRILDVASVDEWRSYQRLLWVTQGGAETLESYGCDPRNLASWSFPLSHIRFLATLPLLWEDQHAVVTHATATRDDLEALRAGGTLTRLQAMRVLWNRALPRGRPDMVRHHVSGHTPMKRVRRNRGRRLVRLDTGAFAGRRLSAWCSQTEETLSVPSHTTWSPP